MSGTSSLVASEYNFRISTPRLWQRAPLQILRDPQSISTGTYCVTPQCLFALPPYPVHRLRSLLEASSRRAMACL